MSDRIDRIVEVANSDIVKSKQVVWYPTLDRDEIRRVLEAEKIVDDEPYKEESCD